MAKKVVLITGGGTWIGKEIAHAFYADGYQVMIMGRTRDTLETTVQELNGSQFCIGDIRKKEDINKVVDITIQTFGHMDALIHNAAIYPTSLIEDMTIQEWQEVIDTNLAGSFLITQKCFEIMKQRKQGKIVFISSIAGETIGLPKLAHYAASKAGLNGFMRTAALEFASYNINVNTIDPGNICNIERWEKSSEAIQTMLQDIPLGRLGKPKDVAETALFLASEKANWITGQNFIIDGGETIQ